MDSYHKMKKIIKEWNASGHKYANDPDYEGFCNHIDEYNIRGFSWGMSDLRELAKKYNTPIPLIDAGGELVWK